MKSIVMLVVTILITMSTFAQKNKANINQTNSTKVQVMYTCPMHSDVTSNKPGKCPKCNMDLEGSKKEQMKKDVMKTYTCPMHPDVVSAHSGTCPKCNKQLVVSRKGSKELNKVYTCSMHPEVKSAKQGKCPQCNMELAELKTKVKAKKS